ncbi:MAG: PHP domain-containing protein [Clostridia bacterium]|nr:PHP domain-containing protein [Clostridia bacterium]
MKIIAELHTHSNEFCGHAYVSIDEEVAIAKEFGMKFFATTNHAPGDEDAPISFYMNNRSRKYDDITFLAGIEADLRDLKGGLDMAPSDLLLLDFVIVSMHAGALSPDYPDYTEGLLAAVANPAIDCMGHLGRDTRFHFDAEKVVAGAKKYGKLIEFNSWSLEEFQSYDSCGEIMDLCMKYGTECIVTSDAHWKERVCQYEPVLEFLVKKNFPEELIINADEKKLSAFLARRRKEKDKVRETLFTV